MMPDLFWTPLGLLLMAAVPIILWLHLRQRPGRRVLVPSLIPWLALTAPLAQRRWRPPASWLLALQLLVAGSLALAAARPVLRGEPVGVEGHRVVVLDVTTSMLAEGLWPVARQRAAALLTVPAGQVTLITLGPRPRVVVGGQEPGAARLALDTLEPGGSGADLTAALALARAMGGPDADIVVISDGRLAPAAGLVPGIRWEILGQAADNVAILDAAPDLGGEPRVFARLANLGRTAARVPVRLAADGQTIHEVTVDLAPGQTHEAVWDLPAGVALATIRLDHRDALAADNEATVTLRRPLRVVQVAGESRAVSRALAALPGVELRAVGPATYRLDGSVDASVFIGLAPPKLPPGGVILVNPGPGGPLGLADDGQSVPVDSLGDAALLAGLDFSGLDLAAVPTGDLPAWVTVLGMAGGRPVLVGGHQGPSRVLALLFDPDQGQLAGRLAFPLLLARALEAVVPPWPAPNLPLGGRIEAGRPAWQVVVGPDGSRRLWGPTDVASLPGLYRLETVAGEPGLAFGALAGDRQESELSAPPSLPAGERLGQLATSGAIEVWPWLVALALGLCLAEGALRWLRRRAGTAEGRIP